MKKQLFLQIALFALLLPALVGCASLTAPVKALVADNLASLPAVTTTAPAAAPASAPMSKNETMAAIESALEAVYAQVNPSVVSIQVTQKAAATAPAMPGFHFFFGPGAPQGQQPQSPPDLYQHGAGSGFVWDKEGHIITNNHVVEGADKIMVRFADGTQVAAKLVGADPDSDLAVIKIDVAADKLQPVQMGDSTQVKVGQLSVAIGNPFSLENTMTVGFVSALGRILPVSSGGQNSTGPAYTIPDIIQTDAPINPGNSGGVLVNDQGEVIGVTAAIESPVRASAGVGFAIPAAIVQKVVPALIKTGSYEHTWLGVSGASLTPELAQAMNLKADQRGALVIEVSPNGPADKAGLHGSDRQVTIEGQQAPVGGDVITAIDGQPIKEFDDMVAYLARATEVGQKAKLTLLRQGKEQTIEVTLAARPKLSQETAQVDQTISGGVHLGIQGMDLTSDIAQAMGLSSDQKGVLVQQVEADSPADKAGLNGSSKSARINGRRVPVGGDVITALDDQAVTGMVDLQSYLQAKSGQKVTLTVLREGKEVKVEATLS